MYKFGQRMKKLRQELGVSQSYLAENIGVSVQSVSNWECDTTMPDISQIVPLAAILGVSTDFLLGNDCNEAMDIKELNLEIDKIWAMYSVNNVENNADYMVYELYSSFLKKYPLNYEIKYKCALALHDYLYVSKVRRKFEIVEKDFVKFYSECEKMLLAISKHDFNLQRQIEAKSLLIRHYILNEQWEEAIAIAHLLPDISGIKQDNIRIIEQYRGNKQNAQEAATLSAHTKCREYVMSLFHRAKCISEDEKNKPTDVIQAWKDMADEAERFVSLFVETAELGVNVYENNPFCYLITAYASMCNEHIRFKDEENALSCLEKATATAIELYRWGVNCNANLLEMEDIKYFAINTPIWCHNKSSEELSKFFVECSQYKACKKRIEDTVV